MISRVSSSTTRWELLTLCLASRIAVAHCITVPLEGVIPVLSKSAKTSKE